MDTILKVMNVTKVYHTGQNPSLHEVSFEVARGEFIGIMGASGSGKTTLLNILSTIDKPTSGEVLIDGVSLKSLSDSKAADFRRDNLGFIFQEYFLLDSLTIFENIAVPLTLQKMSPNKIENKNLMNSLSKYPGQCRDRASARRLFFRFLFHLKAFFDCIIRNCRRRLTDKLFMNGS